MELQKYDFITILGPTASGKTKIAANLAYTIDAEIISADSRQVYRNMDIGTGKDYDDYIINNKKINCHLIDIIDAGYKYNVFEYQQDFMKKYRELKANNKNIIFCGGSGLYIEAIIENYSLLSVPPIERLRKELENKSLEELAEILKTYKKLHNVSEIDTKKRAIRAIEIEKYYLENSIKYTDNKQFNTIIFGINYERQLQKEKITQRLQQRLENGMIEEVKYLLDIKKINPENIIYYGLEYKFITKYLLGELSYSEMFNQLNIAIHQFSKRQMTWFRKMERSGFIINWLDGMMPVEKNIKQVLEKIKIT